jgi:hypothetical protein
MGSVWNNISADFYAAWLVPPTFIRLNCGSLIFFQAQLVYFTSFAHSNAADYLEFADYFDKFRDITFGFLWSVAGVVQAEFTSRAYAHGALTGHRRLTS